MTTTRTPLDVMEPEAREDLPAHASPSRVAFPAGAGLFGGHQYADRFWVIEGFRCRAVGVEVVAAVIARRVPPRPAP